MEFYITPSVSLSVSISYNYSLLPIPVKFECIELVNVLNLFFQIGSKVNRGVDVFPAERVVSHEADDLVLGQVRVRLDQA